LRYSWLLRWLAESLWMPTNLLPWVCRYRQYRRMHGMLILTANEASWVVDGQRRPYAQFN
jgi:hypothetical protein